MFWISSQPRAPRRPANTLATPQAGDGLFQYKYDAWNRLAGVWYADGDMTSADEIVARHGYDGLFRRIEKEIDNQGTGFVFHSDDASVTGIQAGERHEHYYWGGMGVSPVNWRLVETTNHVEVSEAYSYDDSNVLNQFVWGINATLATDHHCIRKKAKLA